MSSEDARVGNLGPALFVVIVVGIVAILMCATSSFIDKPGPRRGLRVGAAVLVLLPVLFFSTVTYVNDTSQIVTSRKVDETYEARVFSCLFAVVVLLVALLSYCVGETAALPLHRQGRNVLNSKV